MKRAYQSSAIQSKADYSTLKSEGYPTNGDPVNSVPPTQPGSAWFQMVTEELVSVIEAAELSPDNKTQLVEAVNALIKVGIDKEADRFVTVEGTGTQTVKQAKTFEQVTRGKKLDQKADLADDSTAMPVWANVVDYALAKDDTSNAFLNKAQTFTADQTFNAAVKLLKTLTVTGKASLNGGADVTGTLTASTLVKAPTHQATKDATDDNDLVRLSQLQALLSAVSGDIPDVSDFASKSKANTFTAAQTFNALITAGKGIKGNLTGNATTATTWQNERTINITGDGTATAKIKGDKDITLQLQLAKGAGGGSVPTGTILPYMGQTGTIPDGYLLCNGAQVSRTTYKDLFDVIGTKFGTGNGSTTFTLPNLNGRFLEGTTSTPGASKAAGVPNISGIAGYSAMGPTNIDATGPFKMNKNSAGNTLGAFDARISNTSYYRCDFNASSDSSLYNSSSVQPASLTVQFLIKN